MPTDRTNRFGDLCRTALVDETAPTLELLRQDVLWRDNLPSARCHALQAIYPLAYLYRTRFAGNAYYRSRDVLDAITEPCHRAPVVYAPPVYRQPVVVYRPPVVCQPPVVYRRPVVYHRPVYRPIVLPRRPICQPYVPRRPVYHTSYRRGHQRSRGGWRR